MLIPTRVTLYSRARLLQQAEEIDPAWIFNSVVKEPTYADYLHRLASGVGCPQVLTDLHDLFSQWNGIAAHENTLQTALSIFGSGSRTTHIGYVQKAFSAIFVAQRYENLHDGRLRARAKKTASPCRGHKAEVYDQLMREGGIEVSASARKKFTYIRRFGGRLMQFEQVTTAHCPLWIFFPTRTMESPGWGSDLTPAMSVEFPSRRWQADDAQVLRP